MSYFRATDCLVFDTIIVTLQSVCRKVVADGRNKSSEIEVICLETPFIKRQNLWRIKQVWQNLRVIGVPFSEVWYFCIRYWAFGFTFRERSFKHCSIRSLWSSQWYLHTPSFVRQSAGAICRLAEAWDCSVSCRFWCRHFLPFLLLCLWQNLTLRCCKNR